MKDDEGLFLDDLSHAGDSSSDDTGNFDYDTQTFAAIEDAQHSFGNNSGTTGEWEAVGAQDLQGLAEVGEERSSVADSDRYVRSNADLGNIDSLFHDGNTDKINRAEVSFSVHHGTNARDKAAIIETLPVMDDDEDIVVDSTQAVWPFEFAEVESSNRRARFSIDSDDDALNALSHKMPEHIDDDEQTTIFKTGEFMPVEKDGTMMFKTANPEDDDAEGGSKDGSEGTSENGSADEDKDAVKDGSAVEGVASDASSKASGVPGSSGAVHAQGNAGGGLSGDAQGAGQSGGKNGLQDSAQAGSQNAALQESAPQKTVVFGARQNESVKHALDQEHEASSSSLVKDGFSAPVDDSDEDDDSMVFAAVLENMAEEDAANAAVPAEGKDGEVYSDNRYAWGDTYTEDDGPEESWDEVEQSVLEAAKLEERYVRTQSEPMQQDGGSKPVSQAASQRAAAEPTKQYSAEELEPSDFVKQMLARKKDDSFNSFDDERKNLRTTMQEAQSHIDNASTKEFENIGIEEVVEVERLRTEKNMRDEFDDYAPPSERESVFDSGQMPVTHSGRGTSRAHAKRPSPRKAHPATSRAPQPASAKALEEKRDKDAGADTTARSEPKHRTARHEASQRQMTPFGVPLPHFGRSGPTPQKRSSSSASKATAHTAEEVWRSGEVKQSAAPEPADGGMSVEAKRPSSSSHPARAAETSALQEEEDERFMHMAMEQAQRALAIAEVPIGAIVVCDGEVVTAAYNRREIDFNPSAHAEAIAMQDASRKLQRWRLSDCTVYVTLEPCLMCAGLMQQARVKRCVFGAFDPKGGALGSLYNVADDSRLNHTFEVTSGVCGEECSQMLKDFFSDLRDK